MATNSCYKLVPIVVGTDYTPKAQTKLYEGYDVNNGLTSPVTALLCVKSSGTGLVQIKALGNDTPIDFTADVFKVGVVYNIYLSTLVADAGGTVGFVGYQGSGYPLSL
jgi:hypothetical protein